MPNFFLVIISFVLLLPNFLVKDINPHLANTGKEIFDEKLLYLNSIDKLVAHTDSLASVRGINGASFQYVELLETIIEARFYHGFSHFTLSENWLAALSGNLIEEGLACKVQPENIIQQSSAACSQQCIVMMAVLRKKNFSYRCIGFPHHYALEVLVNKNWYFFDPDMEPQITQKHRLLGSWKHSNDRLKQYYNSSRFKDLDFVFGSGLTAVIGKINEVPALNARIFQATTGVLSKIAWLFPLLLIFYKPSFQFKSFTSIRFKRKTIHDTVTA